MADQLGETPTPAPQSDAPQNTSPEQVEGETFDKTRAMALIEKLRGQVKELTPKAKQAEELAALQKQREEAEMTELQKLNKRLTETETALKTERRNAQASQIASRIGLPAALADRLKGETPEEMEADAKAILETLPKASKPQPGPVPNPGANGQQQGSETDAQRLHRLHYGSGATAWDTQALRDQGGGVGNNQ